jgi:phage-related tail protein
MAILRQFEKFGSRLKKGLTDFDVKAGKGIAQAGRFIERKALPAIQKAAGSVARAASIAAPILLASGIGAEFAPLALGVAAGAKAAERAIGSGRKALKVAGEVVDAVKKPSIEKTITAVQGVGQVRGAFGT